MRTVSFTAVMIVLGLMASQAHSAITQLVVFGDSLSDTGNFFTAAPALPPPLPSPFPPPPYFEERFSNGPIWVEQLASRLGVPAPAPSLLGGSNFAFAGAETGTLGSGSTAGVPNISEQVASYLAGPKPPQPDQLHVVWAGANDFFIANQSDPSIPAMNISHDIATLAAAGAKQFLVLNLPPLESTPAGRGVVSPVSSIFTPFPGPHPIAQFNADLSTQLDNLESTLADLTINRLDTFTVFQQAGSSPESFGFTNVTDPAFDGVATVVPSPDTYLFWDVAHPTAVAHAILGDQAFALVPEPSTLALSAVVLLALARPHGRRCRAKLKLVLCQS